MTRIPTFAAAAAIVALPYLAFAAPEGAMRGRMLAQQRCATCHNISGGMRLPGRRAPAFSEIARNSNLNANQLAIYMAFGHIPMGSGRIGLGDAGDLAAYIITLR